MPTGTVRSMDQNSPQTIQATPATRTEAIGPKIISAAMKATKNVPPSKPSLVARVILLALLSVVKFVNFRLPLLAGCRRSSQHSMLLDRKISRTVANVRNRPEAAVHQERTIQVNGISPLAVQLLAQLTSRNKRSFSHRQRGLCSCLCRRDRMSAYVSTNEFHSTYCNLTEGRSIP